MTVTQDRVVATALDGTSIHTVWEQVTPALAAQYLEANTDNRNIRAQHLARLVTDMVEDRYVITHQGIAFDDQGNLIDGQHRLSAIVKSNRAQTMLVTRGLPHSAQVALDGQAKRAASDFFGTYGKPKTAAIKILLAVDLMENKISLSGFQQTLHKPSTAQVHAAVPDFNDIMEKHLSLAIAAAKNTKGRVGLGGLLAAAAYFPDTATAFLQPLAENGVGYENGNPSLALLRWTGTGRVDNRLSAFMALKVAHLVNYGADLRMLRAYKAQTIDLTREPVSDGRSSGWPLKQQQQA